MMMNIIIVNRAPMMMTMPTPLVAISSAMGIYERANASSGPISWLSATCKAAI